MMKYGEEVLATRWGGKNPPTELNAAGAKPRPGIVWLNPLSGLTEKTTVEGSEPYTIPPEKRPVAEIVGNYAIRAEEARPTKPDDGYYHDDDDEEETFPNPTLPNPASEEGRELAKAIDAKKKK